MEVAPAQKTDVPVGAAALVAAYRQAAKAVFGITVHNRTIILAILQYFPNIIEQVAFPSILQFVFIVKDFTQNYAHK